MITFSSMVRLSFSLLVCLSNFPRHPNKPSELFMKTSSAVLSGFPLRTFPIIKNYSQRTRALPEAEFEFRF